MKSDKQRKFESLIVKIAIFVFALLLVLWLAAKYMANSFEKSNEYSLSDIKYDTSTYNYVKDRCESGFFAKDSQNCINLREASR